MKNKPHPGDCVYVTKYALSTGVRRETVREGVGTSSVFTRESRHNCYPLSYVHNTRVAAITHVRALVAKKRKSIAKPHHRFYFAHQLLPSPRGGRINGRIQQPFPKSSAAFQRK